MTRGLWAWKEFGYPSDNWERPKGGWKTSTQWKIYESGTELHIGFQYSKGWLDWVLNLLFPAVPFLSKKIGNVRVHLGMWLKLKNVRGPLLEKLTAAKTAGKKIYLYGHSQGGGFAKVVHVFAGSCGIKIQSTLTWGALRVFSWFSKVEGDFISVEHKSDIVPHLPFVLMGFKSTGRRTVGRWLWGFNPFKWYRIAYKAHTSYGEFIDI